MTQTSYPFDNSPVSEAQWSAMARHWRGDGVLSGELNGLEVYADSTGMQVKVRTGRALLRGHYYESDAEVVLPIAAPNGSNPRIDRVVLRLDWTANTLALAVVAGTPAASPTAPALTQTASVWELALAQARVNAAANTIAAGNITDERSYSRAADADKLDGQDSAAFAASVHSHSQYSPTSHDHASLYAPLSHASRTDNPHAVTAAQTGAALAGHAHTGVYAPAGYIPAGMVKAFTGSYVGTGVNGALHDLGLPLGAQVYQLTVVEQSTGNRWLVNAVYGTTNSLATLLDQPAGIVRSATTYLTLSHNASSTPVIQHGADAGFGANVSGGTYRFWGLYV